MCVGIFSEACARIFFFPEDPRAMETAEGLGRPVPEVSSIRAGSDPGGRLRPRGAHTHPGRVQGSAAVLGGAAGVTGLIRCCDAEGWGPLGTSESSSVLLGLPDIPQDTSVSLMSTPNFVNFAVIFQGREENVQGKMDVSGL